jgi:Zn finger protein HypA/HybF involved in hydrogenase expression
VRHQGSIIRCAECGTKSNELATGWRAYLVGDFDEEENEEEVLVFCPECASRGTGSG